MLPINLSANQITKRTSLNALAIHHPASFNEGKEEGAIQILVSRTATPL